MLNQIAYFSVLGKPLLFYFGILSFLCMLIAITLIMLNKKGITKIPLKWHMTFGSLAFIFGLVHVVLVL